MERSVGCGHDASGEVVYPHPLGLCRRAHALRKENIAVPEKLQRLQRNFNQALQEFGEVETWSRHSFPKLKFSKNLLALVGHLNSKILPLYKKQCLARNHSLTHKEWSAMEDSSLKGRKGHATTPAEVDKVIDSAKTMRSVFKTAVIEES